MTRVREDSKSLRIRLALGHLYPEERKASEEAENSRRQAARKQSQKGTPLAWGGEE